MVLDFAALLRERRSHLPGTAPEITLIGALLWHTCRTLAIAPSPYGFDLERRPVPSAGALHPVHVLVNLPEASDWARYNPGQHRLDVLDDVNGALDGLRAHAQSVADGQPGAYLAFVGEPARLAVKYQYPQSLLWRDAGVLQGNICLVAHALGLGACLLGVTGDSWINRLGQQGELVGLGLARIYVRLQKPVLPL